MKVSGETFFLTKEKVRCVCGGGEGGGRMGKLTQLQQELIVSTQRDTQVYNTGLFNTKVWEPEKDFVRVGGW